MQMKDANEEVMQMSQPAKEHYAKGRVTVCK